MKKTLTALFTMLFVCAGAFAQSDLQVLAVVKYNKNESITVRQLKNELKPIEMKAGRKLTVEERKNYLNNLINQRLILQAAQKKGVVIPDSMLDMQFVNFVGSNFGANFQNEDQLNKFVQQNFKMSLDDFIKESTGISKKEYKETMRDTLTVQQYLLMENQEELQSISASNEDIRLFYEAHKAEIVRKDMAKIMLVAVRKENNAGAAKIKINELREKLSSKKVTADQLKVQSKNEKAGFDVAEGMFPITEQGAAGLNLTLKSMLELFQQPEGYVSDVYEDDESFQFLCVVNKYEARMLGLNDLMMPGSNVTVYDWIRGNMTNQLQGQFLQNALVEKAKELNTPENVEMKKTGAALDKLLDWGE